MLKDVLEDKWAKERQLYRQVDNNKRWTGKNLYKFTKKTQCRSHWAFVTASLQCEDGTWFIYCYQCGNCSGNIDTWWAHMVLIYGSIVIHKKDNQRCFTDLMNKIVLSAVASCVWYRCVCIRIYTEFEKCMWRLRLWENKNSKFKKCVKLKEIWQTTFEYVN